MLFFNCIIQAWKWLWSVSKPDASAGTHAEQNEERSCPGECGVSQVRTSQDALSTLSSLSLILLAGSMRCLSGSDLKGCFTCPRYWVMNTCQPDTDLGTLWTDVGVLGCHPSFPFPSLNQQRNLRQKQQRSKYKLYYR